MSIEGKWNIVVNTPMGTQESLLAIDTSDGVKGTMAGNNGTLIIENARVEGDNIKFTLDVSSPMKMRVSFDLDVAGDSLAGKAKAGIFPASNVTGSRA